MTVFNNWFKILLKIYFFKRFYLFMRDRERQRHRQREKQAPCREPDVGLDPGSPGSHPGPKAVTKPLSHPGGPAYNFKKSTFAVLQVLWLCTYRQISVSGSSWLPLQGKCLWWKPLWRATPRTFLALGPAGLTKHMVSRKEKGGRESTKGRLRKDEASRVVHVV